MFHQAIERPALSTPAPGAAPLRPAATLLAIGFLLAHAGAVAAGGALGKPLSLAFLVLAPLSAALACLVRARRGGTVEGWLALAAAMLCWAGGMAATALAPLLQGGGGGDGAITMLLFVLYGVPVIFAVASPRGDPPAVRWVDGALALALGCFFFAYVFTFTTMTGADDAGIDGLRLMFDVENAYVALFALTRFLASTKPAPRRFFGTLAAFAAVYLVAAAYINHAQSDTDYGTLVDLVIDLPFLLLVWMALAFEGDSAGPSRSAGGLARIVRAGSPLMLPASLLTVSGLLVSSNPLYGLAGCVAAMLGYGLRTVLVQLRGFAERERLEGLSLTDALTGLANRRRFDESLRREWARTARNGEGFALLMIDIDHFKLLNDHYGHAEGDARLRAVAEALAGAARRGGDLVARYGGEEFAAILPGADPVQAAAAAETMRAAVERIALVSPAPRGVVTVSIGLACAARLSGDSPQALMDAADAALYEAKRGGRNRVVLG